MSAGYFVARKATIDKADGFALCLSFCYLNFFTIVLDYFYDKKDDQCNEEIIILLLQQVKIGD